MSCGTQATMLRNNGFSCVFVAMVCRERMLVCLSCVCAAVEHSDSNVGYVEFKSNTLLMYRENVGLSHTHIHKVVCAFRLC